jgi:hypothetical protein
MADEMRGRTGNVTRWLATAGSTVWLAACALSVTPAWPGPAPNATPSVQINPALAEIWDATPGVPGAWMLLVDEDTTNCPMRVFGPVSSQTGAVRVRVRSPLLVWQEPVWNSVGCQNTLGNAMPAIASRPGGQTAYTVFVGSNGTSDATGSGTGALFVAGFDASQARSGAPGTGQSAVPPSMLAPTSVGLNGGVTTYWSDPTISVTKTPERSTDRVVIVAPNVTAATQFTLFVSLWDGNPSDIGTVPFRPATMSLIYAPGATIQRNCPPDLPNCPNDTIIRPIVRQDPRPGYECREYMAFLVFYPSHLGGLSCTPVGSADCAAIAETRSMDCGETWSTPTYVLRRDNGDVAAGSVWVDGVPSYSGLARQFDYTVAPDGTRFLAFVHSVGSGAEVRVKRAAPDADFANPSDTGVVAVAAAPHVTRATPSIAANAGAVLVTYYEQSGATLRYGGVLAPLNMSSWAAPVYNSVPLHCADEGLGAYEAIASTDNMTPPSFTAAWGEHTSVNCTSTPSYDHILTSLITE